MTHRDQYGGPNISEQTRLTRPGPRSSAPSDRRQSHSRQGSRDDGTSTAGSKQPERRVRFGRPDRRNSAVPSPTYGTHSRGSGGSGSGSGGQSSPSGSTRGTEWWHMSCRGLKDHVRRHFIELPAGYSAVEAMRKSGLAYYEAHCGYKDEEGKTRPNAYTIVSDACPPFASRKAHMDCYRQVLPSEMSDKVEDDYAGRFLVNRVSEDQVQALLDRYDPRAGSVDGTTIVPISEWKKPGWAEEQRNKRSQAIKTFKGDFAQDVLFDSIYDLRDGISSMAPRTRNLLSDMKQAVTIGVTLQEFIEKSREEGTKLDVTAVQNQLAVLLGSLDNSRQSASLLSASHDKTLALAHDARWSVYDTLDKVDDAMAALKSVSDAATHLSDTAMSKWKSLSKNDSRE